MLIVAPATFGSRSDLDRHRFAGEHRLVDRRCAFDDDAVGCDLLTGADDEEITGHQFRDGHQLLDSVVQYASFLGAELEEGTDGGTGTALRACLEEAPEEDQRSDDGRDLEVAVGVDPTDQHDDRPAPCRQRPDRDQRVHRGCAMAGIQQATRWNWAPLQKTAGVASASETHPHPEN